MFELFNSEKRRHLRDAKRARRVGDLQRSGELYELAEHFEEALEMYKQARSHVPAARLCEKLGRVKEAATHYENAGQFEMAATIFARLGDHARSAQTFQRAGMFFKAGVAYQQLRNYREAATCFEKAGQDGRAAEMYHAAGAMPQAARMYKNLLEKAAEAADVGPGGSPEHKALAARAADCFEKVKDYPAAADAFRRAGDYNRAADLFLRLQRPREAAEMFFQSQQYDKALTLVRNHGLAVFETTEFADALRRAGRHMEAAELYEAAEMLLPAADEWLASGKPERAGQLYERAEEFGNAAYIYEQAGLHEQAAESFVKAKTPNKAADAFLKAGKKQRAAELFASIGDHFAAGQLLFELNREDDALGELQRVPPEDEHYLDASDQIGLIFIRKGLLALAVERYKTALAGRSLSEVTRSLYYNLATALETAGKEQSALQIYQRIATTDFNFRGVGTRIEQLRNRIAAEEGKAKGKDSGSILSSLRQNVEPKEVFAGRYEIVQKIGDGGMGAVYKARDIELDEIIALKLLRKPEPTTVERLKREIKLTRKLHHPNIVRLFHFSEQEGTYYLSMELVEGRTLKSHIVEKGAFPTLEAVPILIQVARALDAAHAAGVIHRDIKPQNILIDSRHTVKVLDFGIAWAMDEAAVSLTMEGEVVGTPEYMSPEQISAKAIDARSDLYSLGVVAYELVTGVVPFRGETPVATVLQHLRQEPTRPSLVQPLVPHEIESIILKLMRKDPAARYPSARALLAELDRYDS